MAKKPSYIETLNAVGNGERDGYEILKNWSATTSNGRLKAVLDIIAIREAEHSWAFEKRICELGYPLIPAKNTGLAKILCIAGSNASDEKKFESIGIGVPRNPTGEPRPDQLLR